MQLYEIFYKVKITDNLNQLIGYSDEKTCHVLATGYSDAKQDVLWKCPGSEISYCRKIADIDGMSGSALDMILTKSCPGYMDRKNKKTDQMYDNTVKQNKGSILSKITKG